MVCETANRWWRSDEGAKGVGKNFGKRLLWAVYKIIKTCTDFIVLIPFFICLLFLLFGVWLNNTSSEGQAKVLQPLNDTDRYIDEIVDGINFVTQQIPIEIVEWFDDVLDKTEGTMQRLADNVAGNTGGAINFLSGEICRICNRARDKVRNAGGPTIPLCSIPTVNFLIPDFTGWTPYINYTIIESRLAVLRIPEREFSVER